MQMVLNAFVISHLHYSLLLIQSIDKNLFISPEEHLNRAIRACYSRSRIDSTKDLEIKAFYSPCYVFNQIEKNHFHAETEKLSFTRV